jgi:hypothetical protein
MATINTVKSDFGMNVSISTITEHKAFETSHGSCKKYKRKKGK